MLQCPEMATSAGELNEKIGSLIAPRSSACACSSRRSAGASPSHGLHRALVRSQALDGALLDLVLERGPALETVLARQGELSLSEPDVLLVRECGADALTRVRRAAPMVREQLLGELAMLLQVRACGQRSANGSRHDNLLRCGRRPHIGPKEVEACRAVPARGGRSPFRGPEAVRTRW